MPLNTLLIDDNFTRANTSPGAAGTTTGIGNGWIDVAGGVWRINTNNAVAVTAVLNPYLTEVLARPTTESQRDSRIVVDLPNAAAAPGGSIATNAVWQADLRLQANGNCYAVQISRSGNTVNLFRIINNVGSQIGTGTFTYDSTHTYSLDFSATGANPTTLSVTLTDTTAATAVVNYTATDSSATVQLAGQYALAPNDRGQTGISIPFVRARTYAAAPIISCSPTTVIAGQTGLTLTLTGVGTTWTPGTPGTPVITASAGTITAQTVDSAGQITLTYSSGDPGPVTFTDPDSGVSTTITVLSPVTSSPTSAVNRQTGVVLSMAGVGTNWVSGTTTFSVSGVGGVLITSQTITSTTSASITLSLGSDSGILTISDRSHTTTFAVRNLVLVNDPSWFWSPYNWFFSGTSYAQTNNTGAYFKLGFMGTSATLKIDTSMFPASKPCFMRYSVDGAPYVDLDIQGLSQITLATGLASGTHTVQFWWRSRSAEVNSWTGTTPPNVLRITGLILDPGAVLVALPLRSKRMLIYGDSRTEGWNILTGTFNAASQDATLAPGPQIAQAFDAEYGTIAAVGIGWTLGGDTNVPPLFTPGNDTNSSWNKYFQAQSRLTNGLFAPAPDYITVIDMGENDGAASDATVTACVQGFLAAVRVAAPSATIFLVYAFTERKASAVLAGMNAYKAATPDANVFVVDPSLPADQIALIDHGPTPNRLSYDGLHLTAAFSSVVGTAIVQQMQAAVGSPVPTPPQPGTIKRIFVWPLGITGKAATISYKLVAGGQVVVGPLTGTGVIEGSFNETTATGSYSVEFDEYNPSLSGKMVWYESTTKKYYEEAFTVTQSGDNFPGVASIVALNDESQTKGTVTDTNPTDSSFIITLSGDAVFPGSKGFTGNLLKFTSGDNAPAAAPIIGCSVLSPKQARVFFGSPFGVAPTDGDNVTIF